LVAFINQPGFLPNQATLHEIGPSGVFFLDGQGVKIEINDLSDGFRSVLSFTLELIRQLTMEFGMERIFNADHSAILPEGAVIVDEIDAHLHPKWQRVIGPWLTAHFPRIQFLVSTHSPLVCQGAIRGSVTRLPQPGSEEPGGRLTGLALNRLLYGDILEALSSGAFGHEVGRSKAANDLLQELARLNLRARRTALDQPAQARRAQLQAIFALSAEVDHA
jgi:predicted ATP-binding protein involved in virulence